jgi:hypothetical protein
VDGRRVVTIDLYVASRAPARIVWQGVITGSGSHVVKVVVANRHRSASTGSRVDVDAFLWAR